jgi:hypothetical protein
MGRRLEVLVDMPNTRQCGDCSLCCTVMAVGEIHKPSNVRCDKLTAMGRCSVYATKPQSCTAFKCLWLQGLMPENLKPIKSRVVGDVNATGDIIVLHVSPFDRGCWRKGPVLDWIKRVGERVMVVIACGTERHFFGKNADKKLAVVLNAKDPEMWDVVMELDEEGQPIAVNPRQEN